MVGSAGGGLYTTTALSGAVEIPAYVLTNFLLSYWGRRKTLCAFMVSGGVACLIIQVLGGNKISRGQDQNGVKE